MSEFLAAIAGAIVGAAVGGAISYLLQSQNLREARLQRKEDYEIRQKALGHALIFKMIRIYSHLRGFNSHISGSIAAAQKQGTRAKLWQIVLPIVNAPDRVHFTTDEIVMLLALKDNDLFNDLVEMDERHNATIDGFNAYAEHRLRLGAMLPSVMHGNVGTAELTSEQRSAIEPKIVEVNSIIEALDVQRNSQEREAWDVLVRLQKLLQSKIGLTLKLERKTEGLASDNAERAKGPVSSRID